MSGPIAKQSNDFSSALLRKTPKCGYEIVQSKHGKRLHLFPNHPALRWATNQVGKVIGDARKTHQLFKKMVNRHPDVAFGQRVHDEYVVWVRCKEGWRINKGQALVLWDLLVKEWFRSRGRGSEYLLVEIPDAVRGLAMADISPDLMSTDPQSRQDRGNCTYTRCCDGSGYGIRLALTKEASPDYLKWKRHSRSGLTSQLKKDIRARANGRSEISGKPLVNEHYCHGNALLPHSHGNTFLACANENRKDKDYVIRKMVNGRAEVRSDSLHEVIRRGSDSQKLDAIVRLADALDATRAERNRLAAARFKAGSKKKAKLARSQTVQALLKHGQLINAAKALEDLVKKCRNADDLLVISRRLMDKASRAMGV